MGLRQASAVIYLYHDDDGTYAAVWDDGATWDHVSPASALDEVAAALTPRVIMGDMETK